MPSLPSSSYSPVRRVRHWASVFSADVVPVCPPALADRLLASVRTAHQQEKSLPALASSTTGHHQNEKENERLLQETPEFARPAVRALATAAPPATFECAELVLHVWPASEGCAALARQVRAAVLLARATAPPATTTTTVTVHLYLTDLLPTLPSAKNAKNAKNAKDGDMRRLPEHANSGFAYRHDGTIVIYRAFGWFKVLLHELLHALGSDLGGTSTQLLRSDTPVLLYEVYVETWARLLHAAFVVAAAADASSSSSSSTSQRKELQVLLRDTALFAVHQAIRWTRTSTLEPLLVQQTTEGSSASTLSATFHEETSGLSYFVCTAALLCRLPDLYVFTQRTDCFFGCDATTTPTPTTTQAQFEHLLRSSLWSLRSVWRTVALQPAAPLAFADSMQMTHLTYAPDCDGEVRKRSGGQSGTRKQGRLVRLRRPTQRRRRKDAVRTRRRRQRTPR